MDNEKKWMFGLRRTSNKPVSEMKSYELALNNCYAKDGNAIYRDYDGEHDIRHLIAKISETLGIHLNTTDPVSLDWLMHSWLEEDETDGRCGIIAMLYALMWSKAELYEHLRKYEDAEERGEIGRVPRWIPVTERMPEEWTKVLVFARCHPDADGFVQTSVYIGIPGKWRVTWNHTLLDDNVVTHWMPLPEPPEVE